MDAQHEMSANSLPLDTGELAEVGSVQLLRNPLTPVLVIRKSVQMYVTPSCDRSRCYRAVQHHGQWLLVAGQSLTMSAQR